MPVLSAVWRGLRVAEHLTTGALLAVGVALLHRLGRRPAWLPGLVSWWHRRLCRALGLRVEVAGSIAPNALLVANHVSWLDIPVLGAQGPLVFLSKAEVRAWPLIGWMSELAGTLFITRGGNQAGELSERIREQVRAARPVVIFPEGTTTDGTRVLRFHPRLFAAAHQEEMRVQPVALRYGSNTVPDMNAPFIGDDALLPHLLRLLRHPGLRVRVALLPAQALGDRDRRTLAEACRGAVATTLGLAQASASVAASTTSSSIDEPGSGAFPLGEPG